MGPEGRIHSQFVWGQKTPPPPVLAPPSFPRPAHQKPRASRSGGGQTPEPPWTGDLGPQDPGRCGSPTGLRPALTSSDARRGRRDLTPSGWAESREGARAPGDAQQRERRRSPARAGPGGPRVAGEADVAQLLARCQPA